MFPLIAISAFFFLGIAFFAIGKDDFGIKKIKENSSDSSYKKKEEVSLDALPNVETTEYNSN